MLAREGHFVCARGLNVGNSVRGCVIWYACAPGTVCIVTEAGVCMREGGIREHRARCACAR